MSICDGRTVIVTGAGGGLGKAYAVALADNGAAVVVNDIRTDAARTVAEQIRAAGGRAVANGGDITSLDGARAIVDAALVEFGEVHAVVNNAGIVRDRMFLKMSEADWDDVMRVHLRGHFCLANVLANRWRDLAKDGNVIGGRIVNTSSGAGLAGSVGQSNYSAAKAGVAALTLVQAAELGRYGITANALAPAARTGMTEEVFADMMKPPEGGGFDVFDPANVAPLVVWLCSTASAAVRGRMFEVQGGKISVADGWQPGPARDKGARWAPEEIGEAVAAVIAEAPAPQKVYGT